MALFDDVDWGKVAVGGIGQLITAGANARAARTVNEGTLANIRARQQAAQAANARLERIAEEARPDLNTGTSYFRNIVAQNPYELSPEQTIGLEDAKRTLVNGPVFRTSGRGASAAAADLERRTRAGAFEANKARQERAAGALVNRGNQAVAAQTGQANVDMRTGEGAGQAMQDAATTNAAGDLATNQSLVNVLGSIIAGDNKDKYKSRYMREGAEV